MDPFKKIPKTPKAAKAAKGKPKGRKPREPTAAELDKRVVKQKELADQVKVNKKIETLNDDTNFGMYYLIQEVKGIRADIKTMLAVQGKSFRRGTVNIGNQMADKEENEKLSVENKQLHNDMVVEATMQKVLVDLTNWVNGELGGLVEPTKKECQKKSDELVEGTGVGNKTEIWNLIKGNIFHTISNAKSTRKGTLHAKMETWYQTGRTLDKLVTSQQMKRIKVDSPMWDELFAVGYHILSELPGHTLDPAHLQALTLEQKSFLRSIWINYKTYNESNKGSVTLAVNLQSAEALIKKESIQLVEGLSKRRMESSPEDKTDPKRTPVGFVQPVANSEGFIDSNYNLGYSGFLGNSSTDLDFGLGNSGGNFLDNSGTDLDFGLGNSGGNFLDNSGTDLDFGLNNGTNLDIEIEDSDNESLDVSSDSFDKLLFLD